MTILIHKKFDKNSEIDNFNLEKDELSNSIPSNFIEYHELSNEDICSSEVYISQDNFNNL